MCFMERATLTTAAVEEWRPVKGYEGLYEVSNHGRVRSLDRWQYNPVAATHRTFHEGHVMNGVVSKRGYRMVGLRQESGKRKNCLVHRLVATTYIPNPDNLPFVNHKNYDQLDNRVENLEWCTPTYNVHYGRADAIRQHNQPKRKQVAQYTKDGAYITTHKTLQSAAKVVGSTRQLIRECANGNIYSAGGYRWKYVENPSKEDTTHT